MTDPGAAPSRVPDLDPALLEGIETDRWRALFRVSGLLSANVFDFERTLELILSIVLEATHGDRAVVLLKSEQGQLEVAARRGAFADDPEKDRVSWTIVRRVFADGQGLHVPEIRREADLADAESVEALSLRSAFCVPLKTGVFEGAKSGSERRRFPPYLGLHREVIGVIYVDSKRPRKPYGRDDLGLLEALANLATVAIQNARLYEQATRDPSTGLLGRRHFEQLLRKVDRLAQRHGFPYGLLLLEPGGGRAGAGAGTGAAAGGGGGDDASEVGRALKDLLRASDLPARYGARTFAAVLPYAGLEEARRVADKVAQTLGVRVGLSAVPDLAPAGERAVEQADRALGAARARPAPAVVAWSPEIGMAGPPAVALAGLITGRDDEDCRRLEGLVEENARLRERAEVAGPDPVAAAVLGESRPLVAALDRARRVAPTDATVLISGESGTGKELLARAIHALSPRARGPLVVVDCGAIPEGLLESELFGHEAGSFTGATRQHTGKFERADGGTVFLDEVGELPLPLQVKLLRAIQEREVERVGGSRRIPVDVRIVAATNRDLEQAVKEGRLRQDLFYRLNVVRIDLPPLRDRGRDILVLARHFLDRFGRELRKPLAGFDEGGTDALLAHDWPGNVRELENRVRQAAILAEDPRLTAADLGLARPKEPGLETYAEARRRALDEFERDYITRLLARHGGDLAACAREMGLSERRFRELRQKLGLTRPEA